MAITKSCSIENLEDCSDTNVCSFATFYNSSTKTKRWVDDSSTWFVEAKSRGLTCDINEQRQACSIKALEACSDTLICNRASYYTLSGVKVWSNSSYNRFYVQEAKRRGLTCGLKQKTTNFRQAFVSQSQLKRKQLQYALKELSFYTYDIDGLYGKGTQKGFEGFVDNFGLKGKSESVIFRSLLSRVDVPSSFVAPRNNTTSNAEVNTGDGYTSYGTTRVPLEQAKDICELQAEEAYDRTLENETRTDKYSGRCSGYGSYTSCTVEPDSYSRAGRSVGLLLGMALFGKENSPMAKRAKKVMKACMAQYGWKKN